MCIRDSHYKIAVKEFIQLGASPRATIALTLAAKAYAFLKGCLLYTSDAADERSSVDLGGRRIIKKKRKQHHTGAAHQIQKNERADSR